MDRALFLWATVPMLPHALAVMEAWGFDYKSNHVWGKDRKGTGYWNREKHEHLLIGTRGNPLCPAPGTQWDSLIMSPRLAHSQKPECFLEMIETYFPNIPKIELNARLGRKNWDSWICTISRTPVITTQRLRCATVARDWQNQRRARSI
jgi:N6-adenosine-specific RNA methylase IME4